MLYISLKLTNFTCWYMHEWKKVDRVYMCEWKKLGRKRVLLDLTLLGGSKKPLMTFFDPMPLFWVKMQKIEKFEFFVLLQCGNLVFFNFLKRIMDDNSFILTQIFLYTYKKMDFWQIFYFRVILLITQPFKIQLD